MRERTIAIVALVAALLMGRTAGAQTEADFRGAIQRVIDRTSATDRMLERFGYTETTRKVEDGKERSQETYDVTMLQGRRVRRLVAREGQPLDAAAAAKEERRIEKEVAALQGGKIPPLTNRRVRLEDLLHCSVFSEVRQERADGRTVWHADFHPNPEVKAANLSERFVLNLDGQIWVDPVAAQVTKMEFVLRGPFNLGGGLWFSMKAGTHYLEQMDWMFGKVWLPERHEFDLRAKAMVGVKLMIGESTTYRDFKEFEVQTQSGVAERRSRRP